MAGKSSRRVLPASNPNKDIDPVDRRPEKMSEDPVWRQEWGSTGDSFQRMFSYFVQNACEIAQHVKIDIDTNAAQSGALFNQENVPPKLCFTP